MLSCLQLCRRPLETSQGAGYGPGRLPEEVGDVEEGVEDARDAVGRAEVLVPRPGVHEAPALPPPPGAGGSAAALMQTRANATALIV